MTVRVYEYEKCSTCRQALKFLDARKIAYEPVPIVARPPSLAELKAMRAFAGELRRLFNTSGVLYREKGLGDAYGRDLYFNLALSWLGRLPMPEFDATHPPLFTLIIAAILGVLRTSSQYPILLLNVLVGSATPCVVRRLGGRLLDEKT